MTKQIAVLGASGFVGSAIVSAIEARGANAVPLRAPRLSTYTDTDAELSSLTASLAHCDAVINAAGISEATSSDAELRYANAVLPGLIAKAARLNSQRFVHVSSAAVQGRLEPLDASHSTEPFSPYSTSKADGERAALETGGELVVYRPPGVHGPDRTVTQRVSRIARSRFATVAAPGTRPTPQAWITNVADAVAFLATCDQPPPRIVHHPHEGMTTGLLLRQLGGRTPRLLPNRVAGGIIWLARLAGNVRPALQGHVRRLEILWFGQRQAPSWLTMQGWTPPIKATHWSQQMAAPPHPKSPHSSKARSPIARRLVYGITAPTAADTLLRGQLGYMREKGWQVHLITNDGPQSKATVDREGVAHFHPIAMTRSITPIRDMCALVQWIRVLHAVKPDAVNASSPKAGLLGMLASFILRVPTRVYILRGARFETTSGFTRFTLIALERVATYCATDVIAVSRSLKNVYVHERILEAQNIKVIRDGSSNGIAGRALVKAYKNHNQREVRAAYLGNSASFYSVLYLGRLTFDKGIVDLAAAMLHPGLEDAVLLLVGDQEEPLSHPNFTQLEEAGRLYVRTHIRDITEAFAAADVVCLPSHREGMPNVILEASSVGLPVVSTEVTGAVDAVLPFKTGLLAKPSDPSSLAQALIYLKQNPVAANEMGMEGARWVETAFSQENIWGDLDSIYVDRVKAGQPRGTSAGSHGSNMPLRKHTR